MGAGSCSPASARSINPAHSISRQPALPVRTLQGPATFRSALINKIHPSQQSCREKPASKIISPSDSGNLDCQSSGFIGAFVRGAESTTASLSVTFRDKADFLRTLLPPAKVRQRFSCQRSFIHLPHHQVHHQRVSSPSSSVVVCVSPRLANTLGCGADSRCQGQSSDLHLVGRVSR